MAVDTAGPHIAGNRVLWQERGSWEEEFPQAWCMWPYGCALYGCVLIEGQDPVEMASVGCDGEGN